MTDTDLFAQRRIDWRTSSQFKMIGLISYTSTALALALMVVYHSNKKIYIGIVYGALKSMHLRA